jgi:hypothetical protein
LRSFARIAMLLLIITGIVAYLRTGIGLFQQVRDSGLRLQIGAIDKALELEKSAKRRYPRDFSTFIRQHFGGSTGKDPAMDPWGKFFYFEKNNNGYVLSSSGPDKTLGTADDVVWRREGQSAKFLEAEEVPHGQKVKTEVAQLETDADPLFAQIQVWIQGVSQPEEDEAEFNAFIANLLEKTWVE